MENENRNKEIENLDKDVIDSMKSFYNYLKENEITDKEMIAEANRAYDLAAKQSRTKTPRFDWMK